MKSFLKFKRKPEEQKELDKQGNLSPLSPLSPQSPLSLLSPSKSINESKEFSIKLKSTMIEAFDEENKEELSSIYEMETYYEKLLAFIKEMWPNSELRSAFNGNFSFQVRNIFSVK